MGYRLAVADGACRPRVPGCDSDCVIVVVMAQENDTRSVVTTSFHEATLVAMTSRKVWIDVW